MTRLTKVIGLIAIVAINLGVLIIFKESSANSKYNYFFKSEIVKITDEVQKGGTNLIINVIDGENIIEGDLL